MSIIATSSGTQRELIPAGNYVARCYQMLHIGTVAEVVMGETKVLNKVRIGWELPTETRVFKEEHGEQPFVISQEFTLSMHEKSNLRKMLASWRGKDFTQEEAKAFDITNLLGKACMLNIIHKPNKENTKTYEQIAGITPMPKGFECPPQVNQAMVWEYDNPDFQLLDKLPDFIKDKIRSSAEYTALLQPNAYHTQAEQSFNNSTDDLPF